MQVIDLHIHSIAPAQTRYADAPQSEKISLHSSCRAGTIELKRQAQLTKEAIDEIRYRGGFEGFCQRYGDYYVAGYRLGGDTGILLSASGHRREQINKPGAELTGTVLVVSATKRWEKDFKTIDQGRKVELLGYDTLDDMTWDRTSGVGDDVKEMTIWESPDPAAGVQTIRDAADEIMIRSENMLERVGAVLERHGYRNGDSLTFLQCEELVKEGIVIELLLEPMSRLRNVIEWRLQTNIT